MDKIEKFSAWVFNHGQWFPLGKNSSQAKYCLKRSMAEQIICDHKISYKERWPLEPEMEYKIKSNYDSKSHKI